MKKSKRIVIDTVYRKRLFIGLVTFNTIVMITALIIYPLFIGNVNFQEILGYAKISEYVLVTIHVVASLLATIVMNFRIYFKLIIDET